ncbi:MAG TPA: hypothetical protein VJ810_04145 [Blastocatellia bacterium]|nr:hypothetical protein [Blastocatellia bacterium]
MNVIPTPPKHDESTSSGSVSPARRRFILLSAVAGLAAIASPYVVPRLLRRFELTPDLYRGPLLDKIDELVGRLDRREITQEQFVNEVHRRYNDVDLQAEFNEWLGDSPENRVNRELYRQSDRLKGRKRTLTLFYIPPRRSHPPHAHHNAASVQCVLKGNAQVRQYERVARHDPRTIKLLPVSDVILRPYESILMTEYERNVHWFGSDDRPAVVLNYSINGGFNDTFDAQNQRPIGRYYVDPTVGDSEGRLILAPEIGVEAAHDKFSPHAIREFNLR